MGAADINPATGKAYAINPGSGVWDDNYFASHFGGAGGGGGNNSAAYDSLLSGLPKAGDVAKTASANENSALGDYFGYMKSQPSPLDFYNKAQTDAGIPQMRATQKTLQGQIYDMEDSLRRIEPDVSANTSNSLVTDAQRRGVVQARSLPIQTNLGWQTQSLGRVSSAISDANSQALNLTNLNQQGVSQMADLYKQKLQLATTQGSRALQALSADVSNIVNITLAKLKRGEQVSDQEAQNAFDLLKIQKQADAEAANKAKDPSNRYITVGDGSQVYDTSTGKIVATNVKDKAAGGAAETFK